METVAGPRTREERWNELETSLGYVIKDAIALSQVDNFIQRGQGEPNYQYYQAVEKFTARYEEILNNKGFPIYLSDLDLDSIEQTHRVLLYFVKVFTTGRDILFDLLDGTLARTTNNTERLRVLRAFYRRSILFRLYYAGGMDHDPLIMTDRERYLKKFYNERLGQVLSRRWAQDDTRIFNGRLLCLFEPWELEQIVTVDVFVSRLVFEHSLFRKEIRRIRIARPSSWAEFFNCPLSRYFHDLDFHHRSQQVLGDWPMQAQRPAATRGRNKRGQILAEYRPLAPHCFSLEQQVHSYRRGYDMLRDAKTKKLRDAEGKGKEEEEDADRLPPFDGDAVEKIPFAWVDAFAGRSPRCRAFGLALPPMYFKFKGFLDGGERLNATPSDSSPQRAAKRAAQVTPPWWAAGTRQQPFDSEGDYHPWSYWCELGFVMWDRDRVEMLKSAKSAAVPSRYRTGWIKADAVLDAMANLRLRRKDGRLVDHASVASGA